MHPLVFVVRVLVTLALFFGMVISAAVSSGIVAGLAQDTERGREGRIMGSWQTFYVIREYKRLNPQGRKLRQAYFASGVGFVFFLALVGWVLFLGWS